jgi:NAD(P)-dependent dehydrogenase (short-subunit alcohol dehydrogenase family)
MESLKDKNVIITGGASGYGRAMVQAFAGEQATVIAADIDEVMLEEVKREVEGIDTYTLDVTSAEAWDAFSSYIASTYGRADILINNAGGAVSVKDTLAQDVAILEKIISLNLTSVVFGSRVFGRMMKEQKEGTIINISSDCARHAWPGFSVYSAAKGGLVNFSKCLYVELRPYNVRVTTIIPGAGNTNFSKNAGIPEPDEPYKLGGPELAAAALHICKQPQCILVEEYMLSGTEREIIPM